MDYKRHYVINQLSVASFIAAFEDPVEDGYNYEGECHDFWEFVYVMSGEVGVSANDKIFKLSEGDMIFHKPWEFHKIWSETSYTSHVFVLTFDLEGVLAKKLKDRVIRLNYEQISIMQSLIHSFRSSESSSDNSSEITRLPDVFNMWSCSPIAEQMAKNYAEILFLNIIQSQNKPKPTYKSKTSEIYHNIISFMESHLFENITTKQIAAACNYSTAYVIKVFSMYSSLGIHQYFLKLKLQKAVLLFETGKSIKEVSNMLHFNNPNYFSTVFKREYGMSPKEYIDKIIKKK